MKNNILITGGADFVAFFLGEALRKDGHNIRILDTKKPDRLGENVEFIEGNICDRAVWQKALSGIDVMFHGAEMHRSSENEISTTTETNVLATANMLDVLANEKNTLKKIILAGTMKTYGEGVYRCRQHGECRPGLRHKKHMSALCFEPLCPECPKTLEPFATPETELPEPVTLSALTKHMQEDLILHFGERHDIKTTILRLGHIYGPHMPQGQSVITHFIEQLKKDEAPIIYEDGLQTRDFIFVHDAVHAILLTLSSENTDGEIINIASGKPASVLHIATTIAGLMKKNIEPSVTGQFQLSDIRHCFADIKKAKDILGWEPKISFEEGMKELVETCGSHVS